jgi:hypothetical protein
MAEVAKSGEGWVEIATIANFNKVKQLVPSQEVSVVADALGFSNFLEVSEDGLSVRRPGLVKKAVKVRPSVGHALMRPKEQTPRDATDDAAPPPLCPSCAVCSLLAARRPRVHLA